MSKSICLLLVVGFFQGGCSSYLSNYKTVHRIETTNGNRYYSENKPDLNKVKNIYVIEDLDGNTHRIKKGLIHKIEKFKHRK